MIELSDKETTDYKSFQQILCKFGKEKGYYQLLTNSAEAQRLKNLSIKSCTVMKERLFVILHAQNEQRATLADIRSVYERWFPAQEKNLDSKLSRALA